MEIQNNQYSVTTNSCQNFAQTFVQLPFIIQDFSIIVMNEGQCTGYILHSQRRTFNPNNKLFTALSIISSSTFIFKTLFLPLQAYILFATLSSRRLTILRKIQDKTHFSETTFKTRNEKEQSLIYQIKTPLFIGQSLDQLLKKSIFQYSSLHQYSLPLNKIIFSLINIFLKLDKKSLIIPSFRTIIIDPKNKQVNLCLFSFIGVRFFKNKQPLTQHELQQILPFLDQEMFENQQSWVNLPKCLAVIILGIIIGKQINLVTSKERPLPTDLKGVRQLVKHHHRKYQKILNAHSTSKKLSKLSDSFKINLKNFLEATLLSDKPLTWVQAQNTLFQIPQKYPIIDNSLIKFGSQILWLSLNLQERKFYLKNGIIINQQIELPLQIQSSQIFLICFLNIDFTLLQKYHHLNRLINQLQSPTESFFQSQIKSLNAKFYQMINTILKYLKKQNSNSQSSINLIFDHGEIYNLQMLSFFFQNKCAQQQQTKKIQRSSDRSSTEYNSNIQQSTYVLQSNPWQQRSPAENSLDAIDMAKSNINLLIQSQIHKFKSKKNQNLIYKVESHSLKTLRAFMDCMVDLQ